MQSPRESPVEPVLIKKDMDYEVRRGTTRGRMQLDWLDARFSFSFGPYRHPARDNFGILQALNEDMVQPGTGFKTHPHENLEIFILPLQGAVEHRDNIGNHVIVRPGEMQKMTAGSGIWHSQMNASPTELDHHLQIWLRPRRTGLSPGIEQRRFECRMRHNSWQLLISEGGGNGSLPIDQDATVMRAELKQGFLLPYQPQAGRSMYIHIIHGEVRVKTGENNDELEAGDAYVMPVAKEVAVQALKSHADVLLFDLPPVSKG